MPNALKTKVQAIKREWRKAFPHSALNIQAFLDYEAWQAKSQSRASWQSLKQNLAKASDPIGWVSHHPWASLSVTALSTYLLANFLRISPRQPSPKITPSPISPSATQTHPSPPPPHQAPKNPGLKSFLVKEGSLLAQTALWALLQEWLQPKATASSDCPIPTSPDIVDQPKGN